MRTAPWFPLERVFHERDQLSFQVRNETGRFLTTMAVFKKHTFYIFLKFTVLSKMKKISKTNAKEKIEEFFKNIKDKESRDVRKIKRLAMHHNIKLGDKRKKFCKKCYSPKLKVKGVKNNIKTVECLTCGNISRWRIK